MRYLLFSMLILLQGCSLFTKTEIKSVPVVITKTPLNLQEPSPVVLESYKAKTMVVDNVPYICITPKDYEKASINQLKILNYIQEQKIIIQKYKEYYETESKDEKEKQ